MEQSRSGVSDGRPGDGKLPYVLFMETASSFPRFEKAAIGTYPEPSEYNQNYILLLTPLSKVLFEKLIVAQLLNKFPTFVQLQGSLRGSKQPTILSYFETF
jgi:hypothetical protein